LKEFRLLCITYSYAITGALVYSG